MIRQQRSERELTMINAIELELLVDALLLLLRIRGTVDHCGRHDEREPVKMSR